MTEQETQDRIRIFALEQSDRQQEKEKLIAEAESEFLGDEGIGYVEYKLRKEVLPKLTMEDISDPGELSFRDDKLWREGGRRIFEPEPRETLARYIKRLDTRYAEVENATQ